MFYDEDYSRIHPHVEEEKAGSVFRLPDIDHEVLHEVLYRRVDDELLCSDVLDGIFNKMGSFAEDWHVEFALEEGEVCVCKPGVEDARNNDFARTQNIVCRLLKCKTGWPVLF